MKCLYCNAPLERYDYCDNCGHDISFQKQLERISNSYYNSGLDKAGVRDLSGAKEDLRLALLYDKENTDARNLLGLIEYETGEIVAALTEWVVSVNLSKSNNLAKYYIDLVQESPNQLNEMNLTIQKYNQGLAYCVTGQEDMAEIQLKKVLHSNPKYIRAYQLLILLYIKKEEYEKARRLLKKALKIDRCDSTLLRYMEEIDEVTGVKTELDSLSNFLKLGKEEKKDHKTSENLHYRESSGLSTFFNIVLGLVVGLAVIGLLVLPQVKQNVAKDYQKEIQASKEALASAKRETEKVKEDIAKEMEAPKEEPKATPTEMYVNLLKAQTIYADETREEEVKTLMAGIDEALLSEEGKIIYQSIKKTIDSKVFELYYQAGTVAYAQQNYDEAINQLLQAVEADPQSYDALTYLAHSYWYKQDYKLSNQWFKTIQERFPERAGEVSGYLVDGVE